MKWFWKRSPSTRALVSQALAQLKQIQLEITKMAAASATLTTDVTALTDAINQMLQDEAALIAQVQSEQAALTAALADNDTTAVTAASANIEALTAQLVSANSAAQAVLNPPAPAAPAA